MFRSLVTNKLALAVVALVPWVVGEVASLSCCPTSATQPSAATDAIAPAAPDAAPCVIYETASGRIVTVKAPSSRIPGADCVRI
jgi:ABC-type Fe3+-hydroxamate transport system substrate-binding protein